MTIQYEVVIWTIINFALLYLVLKYLLFKPMLKLMDERNTKLESGRAEAARISAEKEAAEKAIADAATLKAKQKQEQAVGEYNEAVKQCEEQRLSAEAESKMLFSARCEELKAEEQHILATIMDGMPKLAEALTRKLTEKGL